MLPTLITSITPFRNKVQDLAQGETFKSQLIVNKNTGELSRTNVLHGLWETIKGAFGYTNQANKRLIELKVMELIASGKQWSLSPDDALWINQLAKRAAGKDLAGIGHTELNSLIKRINNKYAFEAAIPINHFLQRHEQALKPFNVPFHKIERVFEQAVAPTPPRAPQRVPTPPLEPLASPVVETPHQENIDLADTHIPPAQPQPASGIRWATIGKVALFTLGSSAIVTAAYYAWQALQPTKVDEFPHVNPPIITPKKVEPNIIPVRNVHKVINITQITPQSVVKPTITVSASTNTIETIHEKATIFTNASVTFPPVADQGTVPSYVPPLHHQEVGKPESFINTSNDIPSASPQTSIWSYFSFSFFRKNDSATPTDGISTQPDNVSIASQPKDIAFSNTTDSTSNDQNTWSTASLPLLATAATIIAVAAAGLWYYRRSKKSDNSASTSTTPPATATSTATPYSSLVGSSSSNASTGKFNYGAHLIQLLRNPSDSATIERQIRQDFNAYFAQLGLHFRTATARVAPLPGGGMPTQSRSILPLPPPSVTATSSSSSSSTSSTSSQASSTASPLGGNDSPVRTNNSASASSQTTPVTPATVTPPRPIHRVTFHTATSPTSPIYSSPSQYPPITPSDGQRKIKELIGQLCGEIQAAIHIYSTGNDIEPHTGVKLQGDATPRMKSLRTFSNRASELLEALEDRPDESGVSAVSQREFETPVKPTHSPTDENPINRIKDALQKYVTFVEGFEQSTASIYSPLSANPTSLVAEDEDHPSNASRSFNLTQGKIATLFKALMTDIEGDHETPLEIEEPFSAIVNRYRRNLDDLATQFANLSDNDHSMGSGSDNSSGLFQKPLFLEDDKRNNE